MIYIPFDAPWHKEQEYKWFNGQGLKRFKIIGHCQFLGVGMTPKILYLACNSSYIMLKTPCNYIWPFSNYNNLQKSLRFFPIGFYVRPSTHLTPKNMVDQPQLKKNNKSVQQDIQAYHILEVYIIPIGRLWQTRWTSSPRRRRTVQTQPVSKLLMRVLTIWTM